MTMSFLTLALAQLWHVFNMRDPRSGILRNEITRNSYVWGALLLSLGLLFLVMVVPAAADALDLVWLGADAWILVLVMSLVPLVTGQIGKVVSAIRYRHRRDGG